MRADASIRRWTSSGFSLSTEIEWAKSHGRPRERVWVRHRVASRRDAARRARVRAYSRQNAACVRSCFIAVLLYCAIDIAADIRLWIFRCRLNRPIDWCYNVRVTRINNTSYTSVVHGSHSRFVRISSACTLNKISHRPCRSIRHIYPFFFFF